MFAYVSFSGVGKLILASLISEGGLAISLLEIFVSNFWYSVFAV
jgi:hypothetical protein